MAGERFDVTRRFVRVLGHVGQGLVEFEFAIGDHDTAVELVMPQAAFEEFCRRNAVEFIDPPAGSAAPDDAAAFGWSPRQATQRGLR